MRLCLIFEFTFHSSQLAMLLEPVSPPMLSRALSMPSVPLIDHEEVHMKSFHITAPTISSVWHRGMPAIIQWERTNPSIAEIRIVLLRSSQPKACAIVADHVENNGLFVVPQVPSHLPVGDNYFLRILSMDGHQGADTHTFAIRS
ncbi:unnamed protein product [Aphanomyces euteiches]|uniref:Yeast cell wall synthesis Kre9/Knh1-like N-terminal domain-containing protein n=1 Tax=Aphanomyces euteiches TaxID=100861 RepID=A0A6G0XPG9_9STRA|nr:hypothetical protein Ae201684_002717 [Aphanomyces euteiches]KAH9093328.1 hypothetical protein Ae201684P_008984 [Aphanomyces euteiches]KAH9094589.1 hypothetical protein LEN26_018234 [Aphanomyces euteiches]KAH9128681.1 hypothetical protein AeMF1_001178 [Aphanomyces euteiches]KAH9183487.1 hypothetical protein AeNC1_014537 [Aphanomyces euteiches]